MLTGYNATHRYNPHRYDNLIGNRRPLAAQPMDAINRAAQFAPFAALVGYDDQIKETARTTDAEIFLDEAEISILDRQLQYLRSRLSDRPTVEITYFVPDAESHRGSNKNGGAYKTHEGIVKRIDLYERKILFFDTHTIPIDRIINIDGEVFIELDGDFADVSDYWE